MPRPQKPPTGWQARWLRYRRALIVLLLVAAVPTGLFISPGLAALVGLGALSLATFSSGAPTVNGPQSPPSVRGD